MRVLLTGAFGYLGGRLANHLHACGDEVILAGRSVPEGALTWASPFALQRFDVLDPDGTMKACADVDAIVHLAALDERKAAAEPVLARLVSEDGTSNLLRGAEAHGVGRLVFFSTFHVYGAVAPKRTVSEQTAPGPTHPYAGAHLAGEAACRNHVGACEPIVLRVSNSYGAPAWRGVQRWSLAHNDFCLQAVRDHRICLASPGSQHRDFVWIEDVARATRLVLSAPPLQLGERLFNTGGSLSLSVLELADRVRRVAERLLDRDIPIIRPADGSGTLHAPVSFSVERLRALGYRPTDAIDLETERLVSLLRDA